MTGFWVFVIVLVICIATVICYYINNSTFPNAYWLERRLDEMDKKLIELEVMLENLFDERAGDNCGK